MNRETVQPHLPELTDEEDEHEPKERGCSSRAHQNDYLNVWPSFIPWKDKDRHYKEKTKQKKVPLCFSWAHKLLYWQRCVQSCSQSYTERSLQEICPLNLFLVAFIAFSFQITTLEGMVTLWAAFLVVYKHVCFHTVFPWCFLGKTAAQRLFLGIACQFYCIYR